MTTRFQCAHNFVGNFSEYPLDLSFISDVVQGQVGLTLFPASIESLTVWTGSWVKGWVTGWDKAMFIPLTCDNKLPFEETSSLSRLYSLTLHPHKFLHTFVGNLRSFKHPGLRWGYVYIMKSQLNRKFKHPLMSNFLAYFFSELCPFLQTGIKVTEQPFVACSTSLHVTLASFPGCLQSGNDAMKSQLMVHGDEGKNKFDFR